MTTVRGNSGWFLLLLLFLLPLAFWYSMEPMSARLVTRYTTLMSLGQVTGLVGMTMFACTLILSSRLSFLEDYFGGLSKVYVAHHVCGSLALVLILFHPIALGAQQMTLSAHDAALLLLPSSNWSVDYGILALVSMILLMVLTLFVGLPYHVWEFSHRFLGPVFFVATLHIFIIRSDISRDLALRSYMLALSSVAVAVYLCRTALGRWLVSRFEYRVESVRRLNDRDIHIKMAPVGRPMAFLVGQFVFVDFHQQGISSESHPFSFASSPAEATVEVVVRSLGDYTSHLKNLKPGAIARIEGPFGRFSYHRYPNKKQIWIAGGIGITPFLSMVKTLAGSGYSVDMYYGANTRDEAVFLDELVDLSGGEGNFRVIPFFADVQGFLSAEKIEEMSGDLHAKDFFLCGPPPMVRHLAGQLLRRNVRPRRIHLDELALR